MAEHCARIWVGQHPADLTLVGRDTNRLEYIAMDLRVRSPQSTVFVMKADFLDACAIQATVSQCVLQGPVDVVLIAHGYLPDQSNCQDDLPACQGALAINGISPVLFAEAFAQSMALNRQGTLAMIGSVAGDRGRQSNYIYGAAKSLVARYAQGLQHRFSGTNIKVVLIKPGPTDTPMTAHLKAQSTNLATVEDVAKQIVTAVDKGCAVAYTPGKWKYIMWVIVHLPNKLFNKLKI